MATEKGISITIRGFIPVDPHNLTAHRDALNAVVSAKEGTLEDLAPVGFRIEEFRADPVNRRGKGDGQAE